MFKVVVLFALFVAVMAGTETCSSMTDKKRCLKTLEGSENCAWCGSSCLTDFAAHETSAECIYSYAYFPDEGYSFWGSEASSDTEPVTAKPATDKYHFLSASKCEGLSSEGKCTGTSGCSWCSSGAVGDSCMSSEDAASLPAAVFTCTDAAAAVATAVGSELSWGSSGSSGIDISQPMSSTVASCLANAGNSFISVRGYTSTGHPDSSMCGSLTTAKDAGIQTRDVYMFPDPTSSKSAATQMSELTNAVGACSAFNGKLWLDIEGPQYWLGDNNKNRAWYESLVDACRATSYSCGVYTSKNSWTNIFGSTSYSYGSMLPLWYPHYDDNASFSDFTSFAGWTSPTIKQYQGDQTVCGMGVDLNYASSY